MSTSFSTPLRRWVIFGVMLAAGAILASVAVRRDQPATARTNGEFGACARLEGEAARACYAAEMSAELASVGGAAPRITFAAPAEDTEVTFAQNTDAQPLLCDLHTRVGVTTNDTPSWVKWTEPPAQEAAPVS